MLPVASVLIAVQEKGIDGFSPGCLLPEVHYSSTAEVFLLPGVDIR